MLFATTRIFTSLIALLSFTFASLVTLFTLTALFTALFAVTALLFDEF
jgi:hypothetical protein